LIESHRERAAGNSSVVFSMAPTSTDLRELQLPVARRLMSDQHQAAIEHAVKVAALVRLAREIGIAEALAVVTTALGDTKDETATPRERAAAGRQAYRASVVAEIVALEDAGQRREAVSIVARRHVADVHDPIEIESLTRKFRRWRCALKRTHVRSPASR
jgi:hypothetical protein